MNVGKSVLVVSFIHIVENPHALVALPQTAQSYQLGITDRGNG